MEEDSGFLQSIMEPGGGTMGPGTAPLPSGPPALGDRSSDCLPRTPSPRLQGGRRVPQDFRGVSQADFFWDSGVWLRTTAVTREGLGSKGAVPRTFCGWNLLPSQAGVKVGAAPLPTLESPAGQPPWTRAVLSLLAHPGVMGVSLSLPPPPLYPGPQVVKLKRCGRRPTLTSRPRSAGRSLSLL